MANDIVAFLFRAHVEPLPIEQRCGNRLMLKLQELHWLYIDDYCPNGHKPMPFTIFVRRMGSLLNWPPSEPIQPKLKEFWRYSRRLPRCGCVLVSDDKVLLVRNANGSKFYFPIGKAHEHEDHFTAAQRETFEETGYWVQGHVGLVQARRGKAWTSLYVVPGTPSDYSFKPRTSKEIAEVRWFILDECRKLMSPSIVDDICRLLPT